MVELRSRSRPVPGCGVLRDLAEMLMARRKEETRPSFFFFSSCMTKSVRVRGKVTESHPNQAKNDGTRESNSIIKEGNNVQVAGIQEG